MMTLAIALPELAWNVDFFGRVLGGRHVLALSEYMFDPRKPLYLRALSLFHVAVPVLLLGWSSGSATIRGPGHSRRRWRSSSWR
jgi:hypothetical protein